MSPECRRGLHLQGPELLSRITKSKVQEKLQRCGGNGELQLWDKGACWLCKCKRPGSLHGSGLVRHPSHARWLLRWPRVNTTHAWLSWMLDGQTLTSASWGPGEGMRRASHHPGLTSAGFTPPTGGGQKRGLEDRGQGLATGQWCWGEPPSGLADTDRGTCGQCLHHKLLWGRALPEQVQGNPGLLGHQQPFQGAAEGAAVRGRCRARGRLMLMHVV